MKRATQNMLYHLLPVVFWLLAIGGALVPTILMYGFGMHLGEHVPYHYFFGFPVAALVLLCIWIISRIERHTSSVEHCLQVALLLGIASYWLPTVLFLILPIWAYLIYKNLFNLRSALATFIGLALVAAWAAVAVYMGWIENVWAAFFDAKNAWGWIPTGAVLVAYISSTIAQQILRVR